MGLIFRTVKALLAKVSYSHIFLNKGPCSIRCLCLTYSSTIQTWWVGVESRGGGGGEKERVKGNRNNINYNGDADFLLKTLLLLLQFRITKKKTLAVMAMLMVAV